MHTIRFRTEVRLDCRKSAKSGEADGEAFMAEKNKKKAVRLLLQKNDLNLRNTLTFVGITCRDGLN
jgi:hypothetical protein